MRRSTQNLSHKHDFSMDMGYLVPVCTMDVLPGDTFIGSTGLFARVAPLVHPVMHKVDISVHHWFVPNRILWSGWEDFITGADDTLVKPTVTLDTDLTLCDHMGIYPETGFEVDALPFRAYNMIWNTRYRDQEIQTERTEDDDTLARVAWGKDYFTTARPQPQQGSAVELGFSTGSAPITGFGIQNNVAAYVPGTTDDYVDGAGNYIDANTDTMLRKSDTAWGVKFGSAAFPSPTNPPLIAADLSNATGGIDLDDLRRAFALQRVAEARMRYGERYEDYLRFYGVNPRDGRLDRPRS